MREINFSFGTYICDLRGNTAFATVIDYFSKTVIPVRYFCRRACPDNCRNTVALIQPMLVGAANVDVQYKANE